MLKWLQGKKSYILSASAILGVLAEVASGQMTIAQAVIAVLLGGGVASARSGATNEVKKLQAKLPASGPNSGRTN